MARRNRPQGAAAGARRIHLLPLRADRELWRAGLEAGGDPDVRFIAHLYGHPMNRLNHLAAAILRGLMRDARRAPGFSTLKVDVRPRGAEPSHAAVVRRRGERRAGRGRAAGGPRQPAGADFPISSSLNGDGTAAPDLDEPGVLCLGLSTTPDMPEADAALWRWSLETALRAVIGGRRGARRM